MMDFRLPDQANIFSATAARIREVKSIENMLGECEHGMRAFQNLPRNMQRRAVSGNPQRMPKSLRDRHIREMGKNNLKVSKRRSRKYRRRPSNLLAEYNRRQRSSVWLETHIWHAKRFHMTPLWGYDVPTAPTRKAFRASIRAAKEACVIQDVSYESCLELEGPEEEVLGPLRSMVGESAALRLRRPSVVEGREWVHATLYHCGRYPEGAIGDAQIVCGRPSLPSSSAPLKVWVWVHPSTHSETLEALQKALGLPTEASSSSSLLRASDHVLEAKVSPRARVPCFASFRTRLSVLKDTLVKFRLTGPLTHALLSQVLPPSAVEGQGADAEGGERWWRAFYSEEARQEELRAQLAAWRALPGASSSRRVLGLVVRDPRVTLPSKQKPFKEEHQEVSSASLEKEAPPTSHPIFDGAIRDSATSSMKATSAINAMRANRMVPGGDLALTEDESRVPVLLMERPGSRLTQMGCGWDVVFPCGWGGAALVSMSLGGASVVGLDLEEALWREFLLPPSATSLPDTPAGRSHMEAGRKQAMEAYLRRPPDKNPNYFKLGVQFPFGPSWERVGGLVLRESGALEGLARLLKKEEDLKDALKKEDLKDALVYVEVEGLGKGAVEDAAMVCVPTKEDLAAWDRKAECQLTEAACEDPHADRRAALKKEHRQQTKRVGRRLKRARARLLEEEEDPCKGAATLKEALRAVETDVKRKLQDEVSSIAGYKAEMDRLRLPSPTAPLPPLSRPPIGYLTKAGFCQRLGRGAGLGFLKAAPLAESLQGGSGGAVLLRNPNSRRFRWARIKILNVFS